MNSINLDKRFFYSKQAIRIQLTCNPVFSFKGRFCFLSQQIIAFGCRMLLQCNSYNIRAEIWNRTIKYIKDRFKKKQIKFFEYTIYNRKLWVLFKQKKQANPHGCRKNWNSVTENEILQFFILLFRLLYKSRTCYKLIHVCKLRKSAL